jgi:predicted nucleic acid-binding protein
MPIYLLDTSVFSQPLRRKPQIHSLERWRDAGDSSCRISVVTVAEVEFGLALEENPARREKYKAILEGRVAVLEADRAVWHEFSRLKARQHRAGQIVADMDLLIAATAVVHRCTVATLNARDFSRIEGIAWEDWSK